MDRIKQMKQLREKGFSYNSIGKMFNISGSRIHQLISGYSPSQKNSELLKAIYDIIYKRDKLTCQKCGKKTDIIVHHIDGNNDNSNLENLVCLCRPCHKKTHSPMSIEDIKKRTERDKQRIIRNYRNKIICDAWKRYKAQGLRMTELAEIFKLDTPHIFYILKENKKK